MSIAAALLMAVLTAVFERRRSRRVALDRWEATLVLRVVETLSLELRCGASPLAALRVASTAGGEPGPRRGGSRRLASAPSSPVLVVLLAAGRADSLALAAEELDRGPPALRALGAALRLAESAGTSLAALADALAEPLRDQLRVDRELTDELAGVRGSADLLTGLPLLGLLLAAGVGARPLRILFHTTAGAICLDVGVALAALGRLWTGRLMARARLAGRV